MHLTILGNAGSSSKPRFSKVLMHRLCDTSDGMRLFWRAEKGPSIQVLDYTIYSNNLTSEHLVSS